LQKKNQMNKLSGFLFVVCCLAFTTLNAQSSRNILGSCNRDSLLQEPFKGWFQKNYDAYKPDESIVAKLKKTSIKDYTIEIFFGTWCGDSRRDVPRFFKIADAIGLPETAFKLVGVGLGEQYKQGPKGETAGRGIYRVATFIVSKNGKEINRITETVVRSLELDLLDIFSGSVYQSNYKAYPLVDEWLKNGSLAHENFSYRGMARQLGSLVVTPGELNSLGHVLIAQQKFKEAITVFRMNTFLFFDNSDAYAGLAEALSRNSQHQEALESIEQAFWNDKGDQNLRGLLDIYFTVKSAATKK
jgi:tetratricopeptide (TPR) repeat protein